MVLLIAKNFQLVKISQADFGIKNPRQPKLTRATETKSNQADLEKFTVCVMGSTRIKENFPGLTRCTCGTEVTSSNLYIK